MCQPRRSLQRQTDGEESLDDEIVEVTSDPVAIGQERHLGHLLVEASVLDGNTGGDRQRDHQLLVDVGEHLADLLVGEVEVAEHRVAHADRHPQERVHRRVVGREAVRRGMLRQFGQPQWLGVGDQQSEESVPLRQVTDRPAFVFVDADRDELVEPRSCRVEHAERAVPRRRQARSPRRVRVAAMPAMTVRNRWRRQPRRDDAAVAGPRTPSRTRD